MSFYRTCVVVLSFFLLGGSACAEWGTPVDVSLAVEFARNPQVAVDPEGNTVAVWEGFDGTDNVVQGSTLPFGATMWTTPVNISLSDQDAGSAQVAVDADGNAVAVWDRFDGTNTIIQGSTLSFGATMWTTPVDVSVSGEDARGVQIAVDAAGNAVATWYRNNGTNFIIQGSTLPFGATMWSTPVDVSVSGQNAFAPQVEVDAAGNAVAVWIRSNGTEFITQASTLLFEATMWSTPVDVSVSGQNADRPQVSVDPAGNAVAIWSLFDGTDDSIQASTLPFGGVWTTPVDVSVSGEDAEFPQVAVDANGNAVAVWERSNGMDTIIQASTLSLGGSWTTPVDVSLPGGNARFPQLGVDSEGNAVVVWSLLDGPNGVIQASRLPFGGSVWAAPEDVSLIGQSPLLPQVAVDPEGNAVAVWYRSNGTDTIIQASTGTNLFPVPPSNFVGEMCKNQFAVQIDRINQLSWTPSVDPSVVEYRLYRNGALIGTVPAEGPFFFEDHNREKGVPDLYALVSVNDVGEESDPVELTLP